jgi:hypothetical protein
MMELDSKSCTVSESDPTGSPDLSMGAPSDEGSRPWSPIHFGVRWTCISVSPVRTPEGYKYTDIVACQAFVVGLPFR